MAICRLSRALRQEQFFITSFGDEEIFDARIADEHIFDEDYDFSSWQEATLIEGNYTLVQSELKPQRIKPTAPERLIALEAFRERSGYDFHLAPAGRFVIAFMTEMTAKTDAEVFFRFTTSEHHLYLDGKPIDAQEKSKFPQVHTSLPSICFHSLRPSLNFS